jgi:hypothetical protein
MILIEPILSQSADFQEFGSALEGTDREAFGIPDIDRIESTRAQLETLYESLCHNAKQIRLPRREYGDRVLCPTN